MRFSGFGSATKDDVGRLRAGLAAPDPRARRRSTFRTRNTTSRWASRSTRRACWPFPSRRVRDRGSEGAHRHIASSGSVFSEGRGKHPSLAAHGGGADAACLGGDRDAARLRGLAGDLPRPARPRRQRPRRGRRLHLPRLCRRRRRRRPGALDRGTAPRRDRRLARGHRGAAGARRDARGRAPALPRARARRHRAADGPARGRQDPGLHARPCGGGLRLDRGRGRGGRRLPAPPPAPPRFPRSRCAKTWRGRDGAFGAGTGTRASSTARAR